MKFSLNQQDLQKSLNYCQGVIEKRSTLPILSNVLLDVSNGKLTITATDLDLIFIHQIPNVEILEEGKTTSSSSIMYDIVRKFSSGSKINFSNPSENKLHLESDKSVFNLNCIDVLTGAKLLRYTAKLRLGIFQPHQDLAAWVTAAEIAFVQK